MLRARAHDPVVDLVRCCALLVVVLGHWVMQGLYVSEDGDLHRDGLLGLAPWTHPLTWVLQVMPVIFAVGGYANARSWRRAQEQGQGYGAWLHVRVLRLTRPLVPLLLFWTVAPGLAPLAGLQEGWIGVASRASLVPTWFLAVYLVVTAAAPLLVVAWDRWGFVSVAAGVAAAALVDLVSLATPLTSVGSLNVVFVWATMQQLGVAWEAGGLTRAAPLLAAAGGGGLVALVVVGPYATAMVGVTGFGVDNTLPPRVTLLLLGLLQVGGVVIGRPLLEGLAQRPWARTATLLLSARLMTVYLWHLTVLGMAAAVAIWWGGVGLHTRPDTVAWWQQRPAWFLVMTVMTVAAVQVFGRFEQVPSAAEGHRSAVPALLVIAWTTTGLGLLASGWLLAAHQVRWYLPLAVLLGPLVLSRQRTRQRTGRREDELTSGATSVLHPRHRRAEQAP